MGTNQDGDQDQYALTPKTKDLSISFNELLGNNWVEFILKKNPTFENNEGDSSIWLRTGYIYTGWKSEIISGGIN